MNTTYSYSIKFTSIYKDQDSRHVKNQEVQRGLFGLYYAVFNGLDVDAALVSVMGLFHSLVLLFIFIDINELLMILNEGLFVCINQY